MNAARTNLILYRNSCHSALFPGLQNPIDLMYHIQPWMILALLPLSASFEGKCPLLANAVPDSVLLVSVKKYWSASLNCNRRAVVFNSLRVSVWRVRFVSSEHWSCDDRCFPGVLLGNQWISSVDANVWPDFVNRRYFQGESNLCACFLQVVALMCLWIHRRRKRNGNSFVRLAFRKSVPCIWQQSSTKIEWVLSTESAWSFACAEFRCMWSWRLFAVSVTPPPPDPHLTHKDNRIHPSSCIKHCALSAHVWLYWSNKIHFAAWCKFSVHSPEAFAATHYLLFQGNEESSGSDEAMEMLLVNGRVPDSDDEDGEVDLFNVRRDR